uniref:BTB domain-containing protein n=1 Tax=Parastrongyloides trichosuri TaxID=131310 RepID=A0A0N4ZZ49_PARTI
MSQSTSYSLASRESIIKYEDSFKTLENISKYGHSLNESDLKGSSLFLSSIDLPKTYKVFGEEQFAYYLKTYNLNEKEAFLNNNCSNKKRFIKLIFQDGYIIVNKKFLLKYFKSFNEMTLTVNTILLNTISKNDFQTILKFYYSKNVEISLFNCIGLYRICEIFNVDKVFKKHITEYIISNYVKLSKTIHFYIHQQSLKKFNDQFCLRNEKEFDDIQRLIFIFKWKFNFGF